MAHQIDPIGGSPGKDDLVLGNLKPASYNASAFFDPLRYLEAYPVNTSVRRGRPLTQKPVHLINDSLRFERRCRAVQID